jgi:hypothetical protein
MIKFQLPINVSYFEEKKKTKIVQISKIISCSCPQTWEQDVYM